MKISRLEMVGIARLLDELNSGGIFPDVAVNVESLELMGLSGAPYGRLVLDADEGEWSWEPPAAKPVFTTPNDQWWQPRLPVLPTYLTGGGTSGLLHSVDG